GWTQRWGGRRGAVEWGRLRRPGGAGGRRQGNRTQGDPRVPTLLPCHPRPYEAKPLPCSFHKIPTLERTHRASRSNMCPCWHYECCWLHLKKPPECSRISITRRVKSSSMHEGRTKLICSQGKRTKEENSTMYDNALIATIARTR